MENERTWTSSKRVVPTSKRANPTRPPKEDSYPGFVGNGQQLPIKVNLWSKWSKKFFYTILCLAVIQNIYIIEVHVPQNECDENSRIVSGL